MTPFVRKLRDAIRASQGPTADEEHARGSTRMQALLGTAMIRIGRGETPSDVLDDLGLTIEVLAFCKCIEGWNVMSASDPELTNEA